MVSAIPLRETGPSYSFETSEPTPVAEDDRIAGFTAVLGDYFGVMGIDLVAGRLFGPDELSGVVPAIVVDRGFERTFFPNGAVGREIDVVDATATIVGVVESVPDLSPARPGRPRMYAPLTPELRQTMAVVARSPLDGDAALTVLRAAVRDAAPDQTVQAPLPMVEYWHRSLRQERTMLGLIGAMSVIALLLAALGTYGVLAYLVSRRTREIGVRIAMGAAPGSVRVLVLRSAAALVCTGLAVGIVLSAVGVRYLDTLLFETAPLDPLAFAASALVLLGTGLAAALRPAVRATRTAPLEALNSG